MAIPKLITYLVLITIFVGFFSGYAMGKLDSITIKYGRGGGQGTPVYDLHISITKNRSDANRTDVVSLNFTFINNEINPLKKITKIYYEDYLNENFRIYNATTKNFDGRKIILHVGNLKGKESKTMTVNVSVLQNSNLGNTSLFKIWGRSTKYDQKSYRYPEIAINSTLNVNILNNIPEIKSAIVRINSPCIIDNDCLIFTHYRAPQEIILNATAIDKDDSNLSYIWTLENISSEGSYPLNGANGKCYLGILREGTKYRFSVKAKDKIGATSREFNASVFIGGSTTPYTFILIPSWELYRGPMMILSSLLVIISLLLISARYKLLNKVHEIKNTSPYLIVSLIFVTVIYVILLYIRHWKIFNTTLYFTSLAFFELYVYILLVISIFCFNELCFCEDNLDEQGRKSKLSILFINVLSIGILLWVFYAIISQTEQATVAAFLSQYYTTLLSVSGTILGFIVAFYSISADENKIINMTVKNLVILYGFIIASSLIGLSTTSLIRFTPLIETTIENIPNLFSIGIFETTLLLIPSAISSLYQLMQVKHSIRLIIE